MKKIIFTTISLFFVSLSFAGNISTNATNTSKADETKANTKLISGKVVDKVSGEALAGVEIKIDTKTIYTDLNGNFMSMVNIDKTEATVKYISYADAKININHFSCSTIEVQLEPK